MNLFNYASDLNDIPSPWAGTWSESANTPSGGLLNVVGGINLQGNPQFQLGVKGDVSNGVCIKLPETMTVAATKKYSALALVPCDITFETPEDLASRGLDAQDPSNWLIRGK